MPQKSACAKTSLPCLSDRMVEKSRRGHYIALTVERSTTQRTPAMDLSYKEIYMMNPEQAKLRLLQTFWKSNSISETARRWKTSRQVVRKWLRRYDFLHPSITSTYSPRAGLCESSSRTDAIGPRLISSNFFVNSRATTTWRSPK